MFTGIIDHCGEIKSIEQTTVGLRLTINTQFNDFVLGESIAIDGVCVTVTEFDAHTFCCDISPETLALTIMQGYRPGSRVNLERSLAVGERMGGHYVTGHVDCTATLADVVSHHDYVEFQITGFDPKQAAYLVPKGSVTINGVSLTINQYHQQATPGFSVLLIPHTMSVTNLQMLMPGNLVNIEFDYYAKVIAHQLALQMQTVEMAYE